MCLPKMSGENRPPSPDVICTPSPDLSHAPRLTSGLDRVRASPGQRRWRCALPSVGCGPPGAINAGDDAIGGRVHSEDGANQRRGDTRCRIIGLGLETGGPWSESFIQTAESEHVTPVTTPLTLRSFSKRACALRYCTPGRSGEVSRLLDGPNTKHGQTAAQAPRAARDGLPKGRRGFMGGYIP